MSEEQGGAGVYANAPTVLEDLGDRNQETVARGECESSTRIGQWESATELLVAREPRRRRS